MSRPLSCLCFCENRNGMLEEIKTLEKSARLLEPSGLRRSGAARAVMRYAESFLESLENGPAYVPTDDPGPGFTADPFPGEEGVSISRALSVLKKRLDATGLNPASGGHLGYIPGGGLYYAALGDFLAAVTNRYATVFFASPGAVRMENLLVRWMCRLVGYPATSAGYLSSGGSMANLSAVVAARDAKGVNSGNMKQSVIYLTSQSHHSIDKAIRIAGLSECIQRIVPVAADFRMDAEALEQMIGEDSRDGLSPWLVIGTAGTTDTGAVDPLEKIALLATRNGLWFHVDAAYGGFFLLTRTGQKLLKGLPEADSIVMDPHKGLFLPYGSGALIVKDQSHLVRSFHYEAGYMQDAGDPDEVVSPAEISPELSRHFRGLRLWLPMQLHGLKPFRAALDEKLLLARYFYHEIKKLGFETGPEPVLSVVIYRFVPPEDAGDLDRINQFNASLIGAIQQEGHLFITSTTLERTYWLRLAVLSFRTHLSHIQQLLQWLKERTASMGQDTR